MVSTNIIYKMYNIPVIVTNLQKSDSSKIHQVSPCCKSRTGLKTICKGCEKELQKSDLLKGFPLSKDQSYIFTQEQNKNLKDFDKVIEVLGKIPKSQIDMTKICGSYLVMPDKKQVKMFKKAYKVFESSLENSDDVILVKFATSSKQKLGILTSKNGVMVLLQVVYEEYYNNITEIPEIEISDAEKKQGIEFIEKLEEIDISSIENEYNQKLLQLIESGDPMTVTIPEAEPEEELGFFTQ